MALRHVRYAKVIKYRENGGGGKVAIRNEGLKFRLFVLRNSSCILRKQQISGTLK